jgi:hypothetical protein
MRKANLAKASDAKLRVLVSSVAMCHSEPKTAGLPNPSSWETKMFTSRTLIHVALLTVAALMSNALCAEPADEVAAGVEIDVYDEAAYTQYVEDTMAKLDRLYLDFCDTCSVDAAKARIAKQEFLSTVRELMQYMNARYDGLDPKKGAALSPTETLVSVHALTMLVDILAESQLQQMAYHPYN